MRLKDFSTLNPLCKSERIESDVSFVPMESLRCDKIDAQTMPIGEVRGKYTPFANGDLLVARVTPCFERGNIAVANGLLNGVGFGSSEIFVLRVNEKALARYLFYLTLTAKFQDGACATMCGVGGLKRISPEFMRTYELKLPPYIDQSRIVEYLDSRCAAIDRTVALLEQKRTAYGKLKRALINETVTRGLDKNAELVDSGVDWIGKVPRGWTLRRLQDDYLYFKGLNITKDDLTDDGVPVVSYGQIHSKTNGGVSLKDDLLRHVPPEVAAGSLNARLKFGDCVFADTSEDIEGLGNCVLVDRDDGVFAGYHALVARPRRVGCAKYIAYQFQSKSWRCQLQAKAFGIKVFSVTQRMLKGVEYACPPISEQRRIADYLDRKCAAIDAAVENVTRQIELYRKLKRSLIDEVVTGRRKVA